MKLTKKEYAEYLRSEDWINRRNKFKEFWHNKCSFCNSEEDLQVHHLNYDNLGKETSYDVILLCKKCHYLTHKKKLFIWFMTPKEFEAYKVIKHFLIGENAFNIMTFIKTNKEEE
jgi:hypothetical protein